MSEFKLADTKWVLLDVDGVMTDGRLIYGPDGGEWKSFDVKDGVGILQLIKIGIKVVVISGRSGAAVRSRLNEFKLEDVYLGFPNKLDAFRQLELKYGEICNAVCVGDDLPDLALFEKCNYSIAVKDAHMMVIDRADLVLQRPGGRGAVRELCDLISKSHSNFSAR